MILNECPSEHSSYGFHCSCIRERRSSQCCHCGHVFRKYERRNQEISRQMTLIETTVEQLPSGNYIYLHSFRFSSEIPEA